MYRLKLAVAMATSIDEHETQIVITSQVLQIDLPATIMCVAIAYRRSHLQSPTSVLGNIQPPTS